MDTERTTDSANDRCTSPAFDADAARRLRRILRLLNLQDAVPDSDAELMASQFSVFGLIASAIEARGRLWM
jgi:hypothetical protein